MKNISIRNNALTSVEFVNILVIFSLMSSYMPTPLGLCNMHTLFFWYVSQRCAPMAAASVPSVYAPAYVNASRPIPDQTVPRKPTNQSPINREPQEHVHK